MISNSSSGPAGSISIFPGSKIFLKLREYKGVYHDFVKMLLLPEDQRADPPGTHPFRDYKRINKPSVFICGHGGRDSRCGIMGSLLRNEFKSYVQRAMDVRSNKTPKVALISHIGGHAFAGNVIIYFPLSPTNHFLAGKGIWYGRVEPKHIGKSFRSASYPSKNVSFGSSLESLFGMPTLTWMWAY